MINRFKNLEIWKGSVELAKNIYEATAEFPEEEKYGLVPQLRRCVVSIGSDIAEGAGRNTDKDFCRFLSIAYGSSYELETQIIIATNLKLLDDRDSIKLCEEINVLQKMIYALSKKLSGS